MHLTPQERDKLLIYVAANLARERRGRGLKLNYPEAMALITSQLLELAREGKSVAEITGSMRMVAEGVETVEGAVALGERFAVDLPIIRQMHAVLHGQRSAKDAVRELMERALRTE